MSVLDPALAAQPRATHGLEKLLDEGRNHAYLLTGIASSGPLAAAMRIAERTLCPNGGGDGCAVCRRVQRRVHPDLIWVAPEGFAIQVDHVTEQVIDVVSRKPFEADAQVVVIEEADTMSSGRGAAGNRLLKVLEEPAGRVVFVLLAKRADRVLPTVRSRAIEVAFPAVPETLLVEALRADGIDEAKAAAATGLDLIGIARAARGDLQRAREIAAGDAAAQRRGDILTAMHAVATASAAPSQLANRILSRAGAASDAAAALATVEFEAMIERMSAPEKRTFTAKTNDQGQEKRTNRRARKARVGELRACLDDLASWWRDVLAVHVGAPEAASNADRIAQTTQAATSEAGPRAVAALDAIDEATARLELNNADEPVTIGALAAELAALAEGRIRARRTLGAPARTREGYDLAMG